MDLDHPAIMALGRAFLVAVITIMLAFGVSLFVKNTTQEQTLEIIRRVEQAAEKNREVVCLVVIGFDYPPDVAARIHELCDPVLNR